MDTVAKLIEASHSLEKAQEYRKLVLSDRDKLAALTAAQRVIDNIPTIPGACVIMSAMYWYTFAKHSDLPLYIAAGDLEVANVRVFGEDKTAAEVAKAFSSSNMSWDGHSWAYLGDHVIDISISRTAFSGRSSAKLSNHFQLNSSPDQEIIMGDTAFLEQNQLNYIPRYILTEEQIESTAFAGKDFINEYMRGS
jgi:hypothetical protein